MNRLNQHSKLGLNFGTGILAFSVFTVSAAQLPVRADSKALSFKKTITMAQKSDPWLTGNKHKQQALELMSTAANTLPDPKVSIGLANMPTNGFDFAQEGITQAKVGIAQIFPRGDTLAIKSQQLKTQSEAFPYQRKDRAAKVAVTVGSLWLDTYRVQQTIALIEKNRSLFEQLADVATASYSSALGKTRQQDIVRAQLELTRLEDRLAQLAQQKNGFVGMLTPWLSQFSSENSAGESVLLASDFSLYQLVLSQELPEIDLINRVLVVKETWLEPSALIRYFSNHPAVMALEKNIQATKTGIKLAQQKYQAEWGVNASYGYRADDAMGSSRADLFSVGVTFDLPIFTHNRQDKEVQSAVSATEAVKTDKILLLRQLLAAYSSAKGRLLRLKERQMLYKFKLLPQIHDQAAASLSAYTHDEGDFSEVVRSRIALLNTEIDLLTLNVEEQKIGLGLNYLFIGSLNTANTHNKTNLTNNNQTVVNSGQK
jgi:hypothetical protein